MRVLSQYNLGPGLFVTGTDTGVGKTVVSASLASGLKRRGIDVGVMKPFQTGAEITEDGWSAPDADLLITASGVTDAIELVCPVLLEHPLAPSVAARLVGASVSIDSVLPAFRTLSALHDFMIVEGAGGLAVPIGDGATMRELVVALELPVLIVARPGLGTISHTHLTVEYARAAGLGVVGVVISDYPEDPGLAERTNPSEIERLTRVPVLGLLQHDPTVDTDAGCLGFIAESATTEAFIERLLAGLLSKHSTSP